MLAHPTDIVSSLGYLGIFLLIFLLPTPQELVLPLAGFLAAQGRLNFADAVAAGVVGSLAGALPWYWAGRYFGEARLLRWAERDRRWIKLSVRDVQKAQKWFDASGSRAVLLSQFIPIARTFIAIPAGISRMNLGWFLLCLGLSSMVWQGFLAYMGYLLGSQYGQVNQYASYLRVGVLVLIGITIVWFMKRRG
ncbi:MAG TPA: DedA family protein [Leptolyngbya sp.]|jgi:membrane protein DedA with SNARE-associated domain|nr:DedA family protein [Leptolyngbya sp.]